MALLIALAFLLQSLVLQTHIHGSTPLAGGVATLLAKAAAADELASWRTHGKRPPMNDNSSHCPLCQAVQHAGSFVTPAAITLYLPWQNVSLVPRAVALNAKFTAASHSWRGRAPPHN